MLYKELFKKTYRLLRNCRREWANIVGREENSDKVINEFVIPMASICALSAFLGILFQSENFKKALEKALVEAIISIATSFGAVYFCFFALQETAKYFGLERNKTRNLQLVGYSFAVIFTIDIVTNLIPELFFFQIFKLYVVYIVWEGVEFCSNIKEDKRVGYVLYTSVLILLSSIIIEKILNYFMPGAEIIAG